MKTVSRQNKRSKVSFLVYGFFIIAVIVYFYDQSREGKLVVSSRPTGARVYLNKKDYGKTPLDASLKKGEYLVEIISKGYAPVSRKIMIESGKTAILDLELVQSGKEGK